MSHQNAVVWVDIPVGNLDRAIAFYEKVLGAPVEKQSRDGHDFGLLPQAGEGVSASLSVCKDNEPCTKGPLIYISVEGRLDAALETVAREGGEILQGRHAIGPWGYAAVITDSEGNRVALHSYGE